MDKYKQINTEENYTKLLNSGMFWEFHPELTGTWEVDKKLILPVVSCSYIILYHNQEWEEFEGTLEQAIEHLKADSRYKDYGRNGATIFKGKDIYSIADKQTETIHI